QHLESAAAAAGPGAAHVRPRWPRAGPCAGARRYCGRTAASGEAFLLSGNGHALLGAAVQGGAGAGAQGLRRRAPRGGGGARAEVHRGVEDHRGEAGGGGREEAGLQPFPVGGRGCCGVVLPAVPAARTLPDRAQAPLRLRGGPRRLGPGSKALHPA
ncbi:unnamed protein product, partial [Effrenium voratum]